MNDEDLIGKYFTDYGEDISCPTVHRVVARIPYSVDCWRVVILKSKYPSNISPGETRNWEGRLLGREISEQEAVLLTLGELEL